MVRFLSTVMSRPLVTSQRAIHWILDWDGTLTKRDTLDALVNIANDTSPAKNVSRAWKDITQAYLTDHKATLARLAPGGKFPSTVLGERTLLAQLTEVEQRSIDRVSASGIFEGLRPEALDFGAAKAVDSRSVQLRRGCNDFLRFLQDRIDGQTDDLDAVEILSVNWSRHFIASCLKAAIPELSSAITGPTFSEQRGGIQYGLTKNKHLQELLWNVESEHGSICSLHSFMRIHSNELQGIGKAQASTGILGANDDQRIISSSDKLKRLQAVRLTNPSTMKPIPIVYVGDSWTDFECLLAADLGICIRDDPIMTSQKQLESSFERLGIECPHIQNWKDVDEWGVVWARDFVEVKNWIHRSDYARADK